jgi:Tfp pilus assembly protein PilO
VSRYLLLFRRHPASWGAPLALLLVNLVWLSAFGSGARLRATDLARRLDRARTDNAAVASRLADRTRLWIDSTENREKVASLYRDRFATERGRLTAVIREIKELAARAGLVPKTISYPEEKLEDYDLVRRSFVFSVEGSYAELRTFLHLLEMTPSFVTVEQIRVVEQNAGSLKIALRLSTLFATNSPPDASGPGPVAAPKATKDEGSQADSGAANGGRT